MRRIAVAAAYEVALVRLFQRIKVDHLVGAFDQLFSRFRQSTLVLSYSSNGFPDLELLIALMKRYKHRVSVFEKDHRYHFGTHDAVKRSQVREYLVVGT